MALVNQFHLLFFLNNSIGDLVRPKLFEFQEINAIFLRKMLLLHNVATFL